MKRRAAPGAPLLRVLDLPAGAVARHPSAIDDLLAGRLEALIVRGVLSRATLDAVAGRLERGDPPLRRVTFPGFPEGDASPHVLGRTIVSCPNDLVAYFDDAAAFRRGLRDLWVGHPDLEAELSSIFSALAAGRPVAVPEGLGGAADRLGSASAGVGAGAIATYTPATIRVLPTGHQIGVHVGNAFLRLPQARHLAGLVAVEDQLSYFIPLTAPESGGELVVYALEWADAEPHLPAHGEVSPDLAYDGAGELVRIVELCDKEIVRPGEGDLLLFDGGRYYHRVTPVLGPRPRRTVGGFLALTRDGRGVRYWS